MYSAAQYVRYKLFISTETILLLDAITERN